ncbi:MAG: hypothetical protein V1857_02525, partial [archaeon]
NHNLDNYHILSNANIIDNFDNSIDTNNTDHHKYHVIDSNYKLDHQLISDSDINSLNNSDNYEHYLDHRNYITDHYKHYADHWNDDLDFQPTSNGNNNLHHNIPDNYQEFSQQPTSYHNSDQPNNVHNHLGNNFYHLADGHRIDLPSDNANNNHSLTPIEHHDKSNHGDTHWHHDNTTPSDALHHCDCRIWIRAITRDTVS